MSLARIEAINEATSEMRKAVIHLDEAATNGLIAIGTMHAAAHALYGPGDAPEFTTSRPTEITRPPATEDDEGEEWKRE